MRKHVKHDGHPVLVLTVPMVLGMVLLVALKILNGG